MCHTCVIYVRYIRNWERFTKNVPSEIGLSHNFDNFYFCFLHSTWESEMALEKCLLIEWKLIHIIWSNVVKPQQPTFISISWALHLIFTKLFFDQWKAYLVITKSNHKFMSFEVTNLKIYNRIENVLVLGRRRKRDTFFKF